jgi:Rhodopirellula transposase DDE domain
LIPRPRPWFPRVFEQQGRSRRCFRLWSLIAQNWRGRPLVSHGVIINSIAATTGETGLEVYAQLDTREYPKGIEVSHAELATVNLEATSFTPSGTT